MKNFIITFLLFLTIAATGQIKSFDSTWRRSLYRNFSPTDAMSEDSCYYSYTLLKIDLDEKSRVVSLQFSDNADSSVKEVFRDLKKYNGLLEEIARKKNIKNISLILSVTLAMNWWEGAECMIAKSKFIHDSDLYKFNGKSLKARCLFLEPASIIFYPPIKCKGITLSAEKIPWNSLQEIEDKRSQKSGAILLPSIMTHTFKPIVDKTQQH